MRETARSQASPVVWTEDGRPRSALYDDVYFSAVDGLAEARAVFLDGCGLPDAWAGRRRFVLGELGFGAGLNILALMDLWRRTRPAGGLLHIFSIEAHLMTAAEAARALAAWPDLADLAEQLTSQWPGHARGFHRREFAEHGIILDVAVMDVATALRAWGGRADAWFLDGFSPALNPEMWRTEVLDLVAARSAPGARAATFTVAGAVRRGLVEAGFTIEKRPGFGRKRERLEARLAGVRPKAPPRRIAVIGAGVAGCAAIRAIRALGGQTLLIEAEDAGAGASGNPAALVTPRLDAGLGPVARLFAQALARAVQLYDAIPGAVIDKGVLQLASAERDAARFATITASDLFEDAALTLLEPQETAERLGEAASPLSLEMAAARVVFPGAVLAAWGETPIKARVCALRPNDSEGWDILDDTGALIGEADAVILAAGAGNGTLAQNLPLRPVRGQVSWADGFSPPVAAAWGGYVAPTQDGFIFGATHDRDDTAVDVRDQDHLRNWEVLLKGRPRLADALGDIALKGRASIRATTSDHLPLAGCVSAATPGLFILGGLGSRGFALAPLLAEHVAALALDAPTPLPTDLAELVDPDRFRRRTEARGRS